MHNLLVWSGVHLITRVAAELSNTHITRMSLKFVKQPVPFEQMGIRESLATYVASHSLNDVCHHVVKSEWILGMKTAGTQLAVIWLHLCRITNSFSNIFSVDYENCLYLSLVDVYRHFRETCCFQLNTHFCSLAHSLPYLLANLLKYL
jgi:hypothetical protein